MEVSYHRIFSGSKFLRTYAGVPWILILLQDVSMMSNLAYFGRSLSVEVPNDMFKFED